MTQALESRMYLRADDSCLLFQYEEVHEIKKDSQQKTSAISVMGLWTRN